MSHVSIGTNDFEASVAFYDQVMPTIGAKALMHFPQAVAYGRQFPEFWVEKPLDGKPATVGNGTHFGFVAYSKEQVDAFFRAAIDAGATADGEPGPRPDYGEAYYGCYVRDPDGHKIEAMFWDPSIADPNEHG